MSNPIDIVTIGTQGPPGPPGPQGPAGAGADFTYVTTADESADLPDSAQLVAGSGISLTPGSNTLTIAATGGGSGTVTSVAAGTGLTASPGPITTSGTIELANTAVSPNSYTNANITVDAQGRLTAAASGSAGVTSVTAGTGLTASPNPVIGTGTIALANTAVTPNSYTNANITVDAQGRITAAANGSGGGGDTTATYITAADETGSLPNSFKLEAGANITLTPDANTLTIAATGGGGGGDTTATYITAANETANLPNAIQIFGVGAADTVLIDPTGTSTIMPTVGYTSVNNVCIGIGNVCEGGNVGNGAICIGTNVQTGGQGSVAIGSDAGAYGDQDTAIGFASESSAGSGGSNTCIGNAATTGPGVARTIVIGSNSSQSTNSDSLIIGQDCNCSAYLTQVVGRSASASGQENVVLGFLSSDDGRNTVCSVGSSSIPRHLIHVAHLEGGSAAPTIAAGAGAGTSPTVGITGTDLAGQVSVLTGAAPASSDVIVTVTFNQAYQSAPYITLTPANAVAALLAGVTGVFVSSTMSGFTINSGPTGLSAGTALWNYIAVQ